MNDNDIEPKMTPDNQADSAVSGTSPDSASEQIKPTRPDTEAAAAAETTTPADQATNEPGDIEPSTPPEQDTAEPTEGEPLTATDPASENLTDNQPTTPPAGQPARDQTITIKQQPSKAAKPAKSKKSDRQKPQPAMPTGTAAPAKKPNRARSVLIGLLLMIIAAAATWYIMATLNPPAAPVENDQASQEPATPASLNAKEVIDKIRSDIAKNLSDDYTDLAISSAAGDAAPSPSPAYQPDGTDFYVVTLEAVGLEVNSASAAESSEPNAAKDFKKDVLAQAESTLGEHDFKKTSSPASATHYQSDAVICSLNGSDELPVFITCADLDTYATAKTALQPFAEAYKQSSAADKIKNPAFTAPVETKNSPDNQYQTASVAVSSPDNVAAGQALFWRAADGDWQYFTTTQSQLSCEAFNTPELRAAFAGEQCLTSADQSSTGIVGEL